MPSPFPGMNPYLEQPDAWQDFHQRYITTLSDLLIEQVVSEYVVKIEDHIFIHELPEDDRRFVGRSDVSVATSENWAETDASTSTIAPVYGRLPQSVDSEHHAYLEIRDRRHRQLITVIELLSPTNKNSGRDRDQYLAKRQSLLASPAHLVEIDLLRGGPRMPLEEMPGCDYCAMVSRYSERPRAGIWPIGLREPLPEIPVPLRSDEADARLDLQKALHVVYDRARYGTYIYEAQPEPPLLGDDHQWAEEILQGAGVTTVP